MHNISKLFKFTLHCLYQHFEVILCFIFYLQATQNVFLNWIEKALGQNLFSIEKKEKNIKVKIYAKKNDWKNVHLKDIQNKQTKTRTIQRVFCYFRFLLIFIIWIRKNTHSHTSQPNSQNEWYKKQFYQEETNGTRTRKAWKIMQKIKKNQIHELKRTSKWYENNIFWK